MATRGRKPILRLVGDTTRSHHKKPAAPRPPAKTEGRPRAPAYLVGEARRLFRQVSSLCPFLTEVDSYKLAAWATDEADLDRANWTVAMRSEHRKAGCEMGLDPGSRARMTGGVSLAVVDDGEDFFTGQ